MHALKDYLDMVDSLSSFPALHQTFNLVPSLVEQLQDYASGAFTDVYWEHTVKPASELNPVERPSWSKGCANAPTIRGRAHIPLPRAGAQTGVVWRRPGGALRPRRSPSRSCVTFKSGFSSPGSASAPHRPTPLWASWWTQDRHSRRGQGWLAKPRFRSEHGSAHLSRGGRSRTE